jgi:hypothetical protein
MLRSRFSAKSSLAAQRIGPWAVAGSFADEARNTQLAAHAQGSSRSNWISDDALAERADSLHESAAP